MFTMNVMLYLEKFGMATQPWLFGEAKFIFQSL
jgi:hypothetical protein